MPLTDEQRTRIEDTIMDLHFTSQKFIESGKELHTKLLTMNVREAIDVLEELREDLMDDPKKYDYKMHMLLPFQIYELIRIRKEQKEEE